MVAKLAGVRADGFPVRAVKTTEYTPGSDCITAALRSGRNVIVRLAGPGVSDGLAVLAHNAAYERMNRRDLQYINSETDDLRGAVDAMRSQFSLREKEEGIMVGARVDRPYQQDVVKLLDVVSDADKWIGAIDTIVNKNGMLHGYNSIRECVFPAVRREFGIAAGMQALIVGAGSTARAVAYGLNEGGIGAWMHNSGRTSYLTRGTRLENDMRLDRVMEKRPDIIVNALEEGGCDDSHVRGRGALLRILEDIEQRNGNRTAMWLDLGSPRGWFLDRAMSIGLVTLSFREMFFQRLVFQVQKFTEERVPVPVNAMRIALSGAFRQ
ncbi:MAG: hypothetical protein M1321_00975 [Candidatus Marsarchaeota archaeon]|nr:hypothetical protein [Candidatus Marsarchaeota archaeon]